MVSVGSIVRGEAVRQFQELGTDIVNVRLRRRDQGAPRVAVALADAEGIVALPGIRSAAPYVVHAAPIVLAGTTTARGSVVGATDALADLSRLALARGRFVSRLDGGRYFCTVGAEIADALRRATGGGIGEKVRIHETVFTVVGELARAGRGERPFDPNETVFIPIGTAARVAPGATLRDIQARASADTHHAEVATQLAAWFRDRVPEARVRVRSAEAAPAAALCVQNKTESNMCRTVENIGRDMLNLGVVRPEISALCSQYFVANNYRRETT